MVAGSLYLSLLDAWLHDAGPQITAILSFFAIDTCEVDYCDLDLVICSFTDRVRFGCEFQVISGFSYYSLRLFSGFLLTMLLSSCAECT